MRQSLILGALSVTSLVVSLMALNLAYQAFMAWEADPALMEAWDNAVIPQEWLDDWEEEHLN